MHRWSMNNHLRIAEDIFMIAIKPDELQQIMNGLDTVSNEVSQKMN